MTEKPIFELKINQPNWYEIDVEKFSKATMSDLAHLLSPMRVAENYEFFEVVKPFLKIPEKPKTLEEIYQEFDKKIDKHIKDVEYKFAQLKYYQEYQFSKKITRIIEDIEYARRNGSFPAKLDYSKLTATGGNITSSFVIKSGGKEVGYYTFGNGYLRYYMNKKPTAIVRFFMNKLLDFRWVDV
jgi:hypothetical protein